jgi:hypothetical protein
VSAGREEADVAGPLYTITSTEREPSLKEAAKMLDVEESVLDPKFGVTLIDPRKHLYAVKVKDEHAAAVAAKKGDPGGGSFSNPIISDFGPPQPKKKD